MLLDLPSVGAREMLRPIAHMLGQIKHSYSLPLLALRRPTLAFTVGPGLGRLRGKTREEAGMFAPNTRELARIVS